MPYACCSVNPNAFAIEPKVPTYCFAIVSDSPKEDAADFAKLSTFSDIAGNVTSTTFCTSAKSEPKSRHSFPKSTSFLTAKAPARAFPALFAMPVIPDICLWNPCVFATRSSPICPTLFPGIFLTSLPSG